MTSCLFYKTPDKDESNKVASFLPNWKDTSLIPGISCSINGAPKISRYATKCFDDDRKYFEEIKYF
jgi:hypothetical protein